jgi:hypothetical protein
VPRPLHIPVPGREPELIPRSSVRTIDKLRYWTNRPAVWVPFLLVCVAGVVLLTATDAVIDHATRILATGAGVGIGMYVLQRRNERNK